MSALTLTLIGGPTALIEIDGFRFLTDPTFDLPGTYRLPHVTLEKLAGPAMALEAIGEIDAVFKVPLEFFRGDPRETTHRIDYFGRSWYVPSYLFEGYKIWGLSAIMLVELLNLLYDARIDLHQPPSKFIKLS